MIKKTILFIALILSLSIHAQKQQASPYSFIGIGNQILSKTNEEAMMGGVGAAISDPARLNFSNPAGLSGLRFTNYAVGGINNQTQVSDASGARNSSSFFSLSYLALGFPVGKKAGVSGGLRVKTGVGYSLENKISDAITEKFDGSGGANSLFLGGGLKIYKGLSIGIEGAFVFGNTENTIREENSNSVYDVRLKNESALRGFDTKIGLHYNKKTSTKHAFSLGLVALKSKDITVTEKSTLSNGAFTATSQFIRNALDANTKNGTVKNPLNTTIAVAYGEVSKWQASLEFSFNDAVEYSGNALESNLKGVSFGEYQRVSFGGYYIPKYNALKSYFSRVYYRGGLKYENTGIVLGGEELKDFGMSFGVGLPIGKGLSNLDIGVEYGIRGKATSALVKENYFNLRVGVSLGDKWFKKRTIQ